MKYFKEAILLFTKKYEDFHILVNARRGVTGSIYLSILASCLIAMRHIASMWVNQSVRMLVNKRSEWTHTNYHLCKAYRFRETFISFSWRLDTSKRCFVVVLGDQHLRFLSELLFCIYLRLSVFLSISRKPWNVAKEIVIIIRLSADEIKVISFISTHRRPLAQVQEGLL